MSNVKHVKNPKVKIQMENFEADRNDLGNAQFDSDYAYEGLCLSCCASQDVFPNSDAMVCNKCSKPTVYSIPFALDYERGMWE